MPYFKERSHLTVCNNLLFDGRIVVPEPLRNQTLKKVHTGHQGMERCRERVAVSVWWPGVTSDVREMVNKCRKCAEQRVMRKEPLITTVSMAISRNRCIQAKQEPLHCRHGLLLAISGSDQA